MSDASKSTLGKIDAKALESFLLPKCGFHRPEVSVGPAYGVDTAIIDLPGGMAMAVSSDPLSLIPSLGLQESAWLSVHLLANDMCTTGFSPMYAQFVLNLPPSLSSEDFKTYWHYIHHYCNDIGVAITGGHTGQIEGQHSTIAGGGTMFLTAPKQDILVSKNASPGDVIIMTKETAISSSAILAMSFPKTVQNKLGKATYQEGCELFYQTSSRKEALAAATLLERNVHIKAMHDVTEGGVLGAVYEMAKASGCGALVYNDRLSAGHAQQQITELFQIDHRHCIGAGSMIIAVKKGEESTLIKHLHAQDIAATIIGTMEDAATGYRINENGQEKPLKLYDEDPYWAAFFNAFKKGWQ